MSRSWNHHPGMVAAAHQNQVHFHRRLLAGGITYGDFLRRHLPLTGMDLRKQPRMSSWCIGVPRPECCAPPPVARVAQRLFFALIHRHDDPVFSHHEDRIRHQIEQRLVPFFARATSCCVRSFTACSEPGRISMYLLLQQMPFRHVTHERP